MLRKIFHFTLSLLIYLSAESLFCFDGHGDYRVESVFQHGIDIHCHDSEKSAEPRHEHPCKDIEIIKIAELSKRQGYSWVEKSPASNWRLLPVFLFSDFSPPVIFQNDCDRGYEAVCLNQPSCYFSQFIRLLC